LCARVVDGVEMRYRRRWAET